MKSDKKLTLKEIYDSFSSSEKESFLQLFSALSKKKDSKYLRKIAKKAFDFKEKDIKDILQTFLAIKQVKGWGSLPYQIIDEATGEKVNYAHIHEFIRKQGIEYKDNFSFVIDGKSVYIATDKGTIYPVSEFFSVKWFFE
ncbi:MAG: hypothetical protein D6785_12100 [Planctomycetota bacterium]|nr:MAG: hypothetical protein D6785_12100 [Planctomycetota bacterium]